MHLPVYLAGLILASLVAWACLAAILVYFDPNSSGLAVFILFYLSLLIASTGLFTFTGWLVRRFSQKKILQTGRSANRAVQHLEVSFRQGLFLAALLVAILVLQSQRMLVWWNLLILVGLVGLAEWWLMRR